MTPQHQNLIIESLKNILNENMLIRFVFQERQFDSYIENIYSWMSSNSIQRIQLATKCPEKTNKQTNEK